MIILAATLFGSSIQIFISVANTFTTGMSAIALIPNFLFDGLSPYIGLMYFGLNIPFFIFFRKKLKKDFIKKTVLFLIVQSLISILFLFDDISEKFRTLIVDPNNVLKDVWPIFILTAFGGLAVGISTAITWKFGGSSGGGDFISQHYAVKHKRSLGFVGFIVSMSFLVVSFVISISLDETIRKSWFPILIATVSYVAISSILINLIYPKYSKIYIEVHSEKANEISLHMKKIQFAHSWQKRNVISGYKNKEKVIITTVILLLEYKEFKKMVSAIDDDSWITAVNVRSVKGNFNTQAVE